MGALVLSTAGSAAGKSLFGPAGAIAGRLFGAIAGSAIDRALFGGRQEILHEGPRLPDLEVMASTGGAPIPRVYGRARLSGRILCGHGCSLSLHDDDRLARTLAAGAEAGVALVALPTTNLYLQDRNGGRSPRRRGVAPVLEARKAGVEVLLGVDNCRDAFYPFGDYDPLAILRLAVLACHVDPRDWLAPSGSASRR